MFYAKAGVWWKYIEDSKDSTSLPLTSWTKLKANLVYAMCTFFGLIKNRFLWPTFHNVFVEYERQMKYLS